MPESEIKSDLHDLKIALQVMSHDSVKLLIPILSTVIGVGTCAGLMCWSFGELQNFSPDSIANSRIDVQAAATAPRISPAVVATRPPAPRKIKVKARKPVVRQAPRRVAAASTYQNYYLWAQDNPTNGRVIRADEACTEYSWDTKKVSSGNRNGFRYAN